MAESIFGEPGSIPHVGDSMQEVGNLDLSVLAFPLLPDLMKHTKSPVVLLQHHHNLQIFYNNNQPTFQVSEFVPKSLGIRRASDFKEDAIPCEI